MVIGIRSPNANAGSDQCCSGEGYLALSSILLATKQSISHTPFHNVTISSYFVTYKVGGIDIIVDRLKLQQIDIDIRIIYSQFYSY